MRIRICGVDIDDLTAEEAVKEALSANSGEGFWIATPNAVMLDACRREPSYQSLLNAASLSLPDGAGVLLAARKQGTPLKGRTAGIAFGEALLEKAAQRGLRVFLLGGRDGVATRAAERLCARYEGLRICGCYWGYFQKDGEENRLVRSLISASRADVLLVCFGFPMQEHWMRENIPLLPSVKVAAGLGGALDVWAGEVKRAPVLLQRCGMEWVWRMAHDPKRLKQLPCLVRFAIKR